MRVFVGLGQGGYFTSPGMVSLAARIRAAHPIGTTVTAHNWNDHQTIIDAINGTKAKVAYIGYSLSANQLQVVGYYVKRQIELGVAYDPSWAHTWVIKKNGDYVQESTKYNKILCYHNAGAWVVGGSRYIGPNVDTIEINNFHLGVQYNEALHLKTLAALASLDRA